MTEQGNLIHLFEMGGVFMWPLLVFSVLTTGLIIERVLYILFHDLKTERVTRKIMENLEQGRIQEGMTYLDSLKKRNVPGRIFRAILKNAPYGEHRMEKALKRRVKRK